ncbi:hypothetical protein [Hymenobacter cellulosilyticus]|uniref:Uncharacterized protein n=1 Tax=Hymenobacter cellulosilyticus TaxID=2932248 RepID=A0A8T9QE91_9BACT|nr:hypothetical protein [Hymenobacter cellulosilyticus]UOQ74731.1 hypothetical protein MUN79_13145 [Hymenobacter cellulosilyticus]
MLVDLGKCKMVKCAYVVLLVLLTSSYSFGQVPVRQEQEVRRAWKLLLAQMQTGTLAATKELMTDAAFASLTQGVKATEYAEALRRFSRQNKQEPVTVQVISPTEAIVEVGQLDVEAGFYLSEFDFEYQAGKWLLVAFYPNK